jgi:simple sugar transport system permease protein
MIKKIIEKDEFITFTIIIILSILIGSINPAFFSLAMVFDILRASIVFCILAFGLLPVIISGGVDISFVAIAALSAYATHMFLLNRGYQGGIFLYFIIGCTIGMAAGLLNGFLVTRFNLLIFDVSLATFTMWYGFIRFFIGSQRSFTIPAGAGNFSSEFIVTVSNPFVGISGLHISVLYVLVIGILIAFMLKYTTFGRGIYAIGGNREVAIRSGFNVNKIILVTLMIMGGLAAFAGITYSFLVRHFDPTVFMGQELDVIAAIILGGASLSGGKGSVIGSFMGVILIQLIHRAMILTGISVEWQDLMIGILLIFFISIPYIRELINRLTFGVNTSPDKK